jgi:hypothetical protein
VNKRAEERERVKVRIVERAQKDEAFKAQLKSDPRKAIESELGKSLPANVQFHVVEETASSLYLVLPESPSKELSDQDLESVTGGATDFTFFMY